jgi:biotin synthase
VTVGKGLDEKKVEFVAEAAQAIKSKISDIHLIACNGTASKEQLLYLKQHGIDSYNHNLETSEKYYSEICQTHTWAERYETCENVKVSGLSLCCGGIFGMGEEESDRASLITSIASLGPESVPLNFYHPNPALPIVKRNIERKQALEIITKTRESIGGNKLLMVAGGRELLFNSYEKEMFQAGANAIVIGDYLTTSGMEPNSDIQMLEQLNYRIASSCDTL